MLKEPIYITHAITPNKIGRIEKPVFDMPIKYEFVISPTNGSTDLAIYGERVHKILRASINSRLAKRIKEGDVAYYGIEPPTDEMEVTDEETGTIEIVKGYVEPYGAGANYKVISVRPQNVKTMVYLEKLP